MIKETYRLQYIDGLRGLAIVGVVGFHTFPNWLTSGFTGVDIFFVISGYLLTSIILATSHNRDFSIKDFFLRRAKRIFPSLFLLFLISLFFGYIFLLDDEFYLLAKHIISTILLVPNYIFWQEINYFDNKSYTKPLLHLWSLGVEFQTYIFLPILFIFIKKKNYKIVTVLLSIILLSFILNIQIANYDQQFSFYSQITRFWQFLIGSLIAYYFLVKKTSYIENFFLRNLLSILGLILIFLSFFYIPEKKFPGFFSLLPTLGTALILLSQDDTYLNKLILSNKFIVWIGLISFPLYLFHWPILVWTRLMTERLLLPQERIFIILISIILSFLIYFFLEKKFQRIDNKKFLTKLFFFKLFFIITTLLIIISIIKPRNSGLDLSLILNAKTDWVYPGNNFKKIFDKDLRMFEAYGGKEKTIYIGDSNMEQYAPRLNYILDKNWNVPLIIGNQKNCKLLNELISGTHDQCEKQIIKLKKIMNDPKVTKIVFAAYWLDYQNELFYDDLFVNLIKTYIDKEKKIYFILNSPSDDSLDPKNMVNLDRFRRIAEKKNLLFDKKIFINKFFSVHTKIKKIANITNAEIIDPLETLCKDECLIFNSNGVPNYLNYNHMTSSYSKNNAKFIDKTLNPKN